MKLLLIFLTLFISNGLCKITTFKESDQLKDNRKPFTLDDFLARKISLKGFNGKWISDNEFVYKTPEGNLNIYNADNKLDKEFVKIQDKWEGGTYTISPNKKQILFRYEIESIFRHSTVAYYDIYDIETSTTSQIMNHKKLQYCQWSPASDSIAFVYRNDVYLRKSDSKEYRLTTTGEIGVVYNGVPDWVYEEEVLGTGGALWYSPDGQNIAIGVFNDKHVDSFNVVLYDPIPEEKIQYPLLQSIKYPKPGTNNPKVELKVIDVNSIKDDDKNIDDKWISLLAPIHLVSDDHILNSVTWIDGKRLLATWLNRRQNIGSIQSCNVQGVCEDLYQLSEPNGWIAAGEPKCLSNGKICLLLNWIGDWMKIQKLDLIKKTIDTNDEYPGNFTIIEIFGYKESTNDMYYLGTAKNNPTQKNVYRNKECISCNIKDSNEIPCTYSKAVFSKDLKYYALTCQGPTPSYTKIINSDTQKEISTWETNEEARKLIDKYQSPNIKYLNVPVSGGYNAAVKLLLPPELDFETTNSEKTYPMIVFVYGGPNSVRVSDQFSIGFETYLTTTRKIIYAFIDGRGSGYKGKNMMYEINNRMGTVEVEDQISVTKYLQKTYKFIDSKHTGIWGWSYGGYVTAMSLAKDNEHVFRCGISVAPVTSWIYYDSIYTERYMGLPTITDNLANYVAGDVTRDITNFKNHDYLLIHGSADDNVHYQQSMVLSKALQNATILFEQMSYPDEDHSLASVYPHLYHTMDQFWGKCLNLDTEDE